MSSQGVATTVVYMAYNTSTGAYQTGDQANHTLKLVKDGTEASPTNASAEVDSTNTPGAYKLALTTAETSFGTVWLGGKSSTASVIIIPITVTFEILPTALTGGSNVKSDALAINGVATSSVTTVNANIGETQPINFTGTGGSALVKSDAVDIAGSAVATGSAQVGVNVVNIAGSAVSTSSAQIGTNVVNIAGSAVSTTSAQIGTNVVNIAGQAAALDANNLLKVDVEDIGGSATGGTNLGKTTVAIGRGTCTTGGSTVSVPTSAFAPGGASIVSNQFVGRTILFDGTTATGALQGQASNITANTSGATPTFTVSAMATAPSSGDTFSVV